MRIILSGLSGIVIALLLFWIMQSLISGSRDLNTDRDQGLRLDFIQVDQDELERIKERKPPPEPEPPKKPPPPKLVVNNPDPPKQNMPKMDMPRISLGVASGEGPYLGGWSADSPGVDGDVIPIVRIDPQWPREALLDGISGYVILEFTIEADGSVSDAVVVESEPRRLFDRNAVRAIYKWKFKPRVVDGRPVARRASTRIDFQLQQ
ncbi:MAG TPA: energy transducer TonB [Woeseiaceae bacterium]|jgi:protein TonB|nr:energy transducer TonB [Woeseiaceae bacterium]